LPNGKNLDQNQMYPWTCNFSWHFC